MTSEAPAGTSIAGLAKHETSGANTPGVLSQLPGVLGDDAEGPQKSFKPSNTLYSTCPSNIQTSQGLGRFFQMELVNNGLKTGRWFGSRSNYSTTRASAARRRASTVSFHNFKSQSFKLSVSNPKNKYVACLSVLSQISNCQSLGRKNKH